MEFNNILKLINAVSNSSLSSFSLDDGNIKLDFENVKSVSDNSYKADNNSTESIDNVNIISENKQLLNITAKKEVDKDIFSESKINELQDADNINENKNQLTGKSITSPLVGTFYNAESPQDKPFVAVGDTVKKGQVIGIIEAMKLMNEIESDYDGVVKEILVNNEDIVEYGQPLFIIE